MVKMMISSFYLVFLAGLALVNAEWIPIVARKPKSLIIFQVDTETGNCTDAKVVFDGIIEKSLTNFVLDVKNNLTFIVDGWSSPQQDKVRIVKITDNGNDDKNEQVLTRESGAADELISNQAYDWITQKLYISLDRVGAKRAGQIEACNLNDKKQCTILLGNDFGMHCLVVDPIEGYMYWLNKIKNRIESSWMSGQFYDPYPFHEPYANDERVHVDGLTMDHIDKTLYYLRIWQDKCEIVSCKIHDRTSCKIIYKPNDVSHMAAINGIVFWTNNHGQLRFCQKDDCEKTIKIVKNTKALERFNFLHENSQPILRKNPCEVENGECSDFCLIVPGEPSRKCSCPIGIKLLSDDKTCDPIGIRKVLLIAAKTSLFYISLDTKDYIPTRISFENVENLNNSIIDVDYDPINQKIYWLDVGNHEIRRSKLDGTEFEVVMRNISNDLTEIAVDWLGNNIFMLDSKNGKIEAQKIGSEFKKPIVFSGLFKPCCLQVDPQTGFLYFANFYGENWRIERTQMDGTNRQIIFLLPRMRNMSEMFIDTEKREIYWIEENTTKINMVRLTDDANVKTIPVNSQTLKSITKIGNVLYTNSPIGRSITSITLEKGIDYDNLQPETFDSVIFHQISMKAVVLKPNLQTLIERKSTTNGMMNQNKSNRLNHHGCYPNNAGCEQICVNLPNDKYRCLCKVGYELQTDGISCKKPEVYLIFSQANVMDDLMRISMNADAPNYEQMAISNISIVPNVLAFDSMRNVIYFAVEHVNGHAGAIYKANLLNGASEMIVQDPYLKNIRGIAVDIISGNIFWSNGYLKRIEAATMNGKHRTTIMSNKINPSFLRIHNKRREIYFVNVGEYETSIMMTTITGSKYGTIIVGDIGKAGKVTGMDIDMKNDRVVWTTIGEYGGTIHAQQINGIGTREQIIGHELILPRTLNIFNGTVYFANEATKTIDVVKSDMTSSHLHYNLPLIRQLVVIHEEKDDIVDPCLNTETPKDALCLVGSKMNLTWKCKDQYDFTGKTNECLPPNNFLIIAAKEKFLRFKIKTNSSNIVFDDDPFVILPISSVGHPTSIVYDALSTERYLYWIDAHDQHNGRIKKASDDGTIPSKYLNLKHDSNCSQIFDLVIDEIGRQLFVSCTTKDAGDIGYIHAWKIDDEEDELKYVGKIIAGDRKSTATNTFPMPKKMAIFGRLNALFYVDCSRMLESPVIVRCHIDGRQCSVVVSKNLDCSTIKLETDLSSPRLIYTTINGIWSRDVYVDGDLRQLVHLDTVGQHISLAALDEKTMLIVASNETRHEDSVLEFHYNITMKELSDLKVTDWSKQAMDLTKKISSIHLVGMGGLEPSRSEFTCKKSECSHLCRIPYDTGSLDRRKYECLCPVDYNLSSAVKCEKNLECSSWQYRCVNGRQCIHIAKRCDGVPDCTDSSDEHPGLCHTLRTVNPTDKHSISSLAGKVMWTCDGGRTTAIGLHQLCNGFTDCMDDSDEKHCRCNSPVDEFDCTMWQKWATKSYVENGPECVPRSQLCDGKQHCSNGADELLLLCSLINPQDSPEMNYGSLFDFSIKQPASVIIGAALLAVIVLMLMIGCCVCCYYRHKKMKYKKQHYPCEHEPNASTTLLSGQRTMITNTSTPLPQMMSTRVLLPQQPTHQVEVALKTYPCSTGGSDYGYVPMPLMGTFQRPKNESHGNLMISGYNSLPWQARQHPQEHLIVVRSTGSTATSSVILPPPNGHSETIFYAPPPSAASLSTYGVVKPAGMKVVLTPRTERRNKRTRRKDERMREENMQMNCPPSYSDIGSTKRNVYQRNRQYNRARYDVEDSSSKSSSEAEHFEEFVPKPQMKLPGKKLTSSSSSAPTGAMAPVNSSNSSDSRPS